MQRIFICAKARLAKASHGAHRLENPLHLAYFGGIGFGFHGYSWLALGCLGCGLLAALSAFLED